MAGKAAILVPSNSPVPLTCRRGEGERSRRQELFGQHRGSENALGRGGRSTHLLVDTEPALAGCR